MTRRALGALAAGLLILFTFPLSGALGADYNVGAHLHVAVLNEPSPGHPIAKAPYTFHLVLQTHDQIGTTGYLRIDDSSTTRAKMNVAIGPGNSLLAFDWTVDFSGWASGQHEVRWHLDIKKNAEGNRQYTTSRATLCVVTCSGKVGNGGRYVTGGGSWYTGHDYLVPVTSSPLSAWVPGGTVTVQSEYSRAKSLVVLLNPNLHAGILGTQLAAWGAGNGSHQLSLAGLAPGDNIVVISGDGQEAGVLHLKLGDGSDAETYYLETQSWWAKSGLVLP